MHHRCCKYVFTYNFRVNKIFPHCRGRKGHRNDITRILIECRKAYFLHIKDLNIKRHSCDVLKQKKSKQGTVTVTQASIANEI